MYTIVWRVTRHGLQFGRKWVTEAWELPPPPPPRLTPDDIPWSKFEEERWGGGLGYLLDLPTGSWALDDGAVVDEVRHETCDVYTRSLDLSDVEQAYEDSTGKRVRLEFTKYAFAANRHVHPDEAYWYWEPEEYEEFDQKDSLRDPDYALWTARRKMLSDLRQNVTAGRHRFWEMPEFDEDDLREYGLSGGMLGPNGPVVELDPEDFE